MENPAGAYFTDYEEPGTRLTKTWDVTTLRYRKSSNFNTSLNAYFVVNGFKISHKILNLYTTKYSFYCLLYLRVDYDIFELWRHKP